MNTRTCITGKVHYVGVNDRQKQLFEGMWPLPYGVSYNSYIINDDEVALVDTVDVNFFESYLKRIRKIIGDKEIKYLIVNHMEPDHSGSIGLIKQYYPNITIVGNKQTFNMIKGFYGVSSNELVIKEGDTLNLGETTLKFYMTPMVHWPETMMTYDETNQILFSGDAFGCFGALNGHFLDSKIKLDIFEDEMIRYYSNIVGKYGSPVQKALKKLSGVELSYICSTHGPVWGKDNISKVVSIYNKLSLYEAEEGVVIAYGSMYGNTEEMAEEIAHELAESGIKNIVIHNLNTTNPSYVIADIFKYKGLLIGSPTYCNQIYPNVESLMSKIVSREVKNRYIGFFGSFSWAGNAVKRMKEMLKTSKMEVIESSIEMKHAISDEDAKNCDSLAQEMVQLLKNN